MGVSTNAYLVFGVPIGSADDGWRSERLEALHDSVYERNQDQSCEVDVWLAETLGLQLVESDVSPYKQVSKWYDERGLEFFSHCAQEYEMHMLIARELCYTACRGEELSIPDKLPAVPKPVRQELEKACDKLGLAIDTIGWYLVSYWG
jgi:hypothetical protein